MLQPHLRVLGPAAKLIKRDITDASDWYQAYWNRIPVLVHEEEVLLEGRPDAEEVDRVIGALIGFGEGDA